MASTFSSRNWGAASEAVKAALEAFAAGAAAVGIACLLWPAAAQRRAIALGVAVAWLASSAGASALILAKARSPEAFWWAFGAGMAARLAVLIALVVFSVYHPGLSQPGLLVSYALGVLGFLLLEYRHVRLK